ncbi:MAG TPA: hypothetical protein VGE51_12805 [Fontimonas sp.]
MDRVTHRNQRLAALLLMLLSMALPGIARAADESAAADEVMQAYVAACGGRENLDRIQNRVTESKLSMGWISAGVKSTLVRPDRFVDEAKLLGMASGSGYDGTTGWTRDGGKLTVVTGAELTRLLRGHSLDWYKQYPAWYPVRRRLPDAMLDGAAMHVIELTATTGETEIWRFDAQTGLLSQIEGYKFEKDKEPVKVISTLGDYRKVDGVTLPHSVKATDGKRTFSAVVETLRHNQTLAPIRFPADD